MKKMKTIKTMTAAFACTLLMASAAFTSFAAADYKTPAEAAAGVTGKTLEDVNAEWNNGKSYGAIAAESGKLTEYHNAILAICEDDLNAQVAAGRLTRSQADAQLANITSNQANCDGTSYGCGHSGCGNSSYGHNYNSGSSTGTHHSNRHSGGRHGGSNHY